MKTFDMIRNNDESGVSGTGKVLEGAIFSNGTVIVYWTASDVKSFGWYSNYYDFYKIHIAAHPTNMTEIKFHDSMKPVIRDAEALCRHCKHRYDEHPRDFQGDEAMLIRSCAGNLVDAR